MHRGSEKKRLQALEEEERRFSPSETEFIAEPPFELAGNRVLVARILAKSDEACQGFCLRYPLERGD